MAISDRISSIEEHIKESYQELEGIGIDTTGVNNNLENIPKLLDGYWETLPKVTGEGTSITLDNTKEGKMKINLKGNTSQEGTPTPETPQNIHVVSGENNIVVCGENLLDETYYNNSSLYTKIGNFYAYVELPDIFKTKFYVNMNLKGTSQNLVYGFSNEISGTFSGGMRVLSGGTINTNVECDFTNAEHVYMAIGNGSTITLATDIPKIFENYNIMVSTTSNEPYEAYTGASYPINLGDIELCKIGDYQDRFIRNSGKNLANYLDIPDAPSWDLYPTNSKYIELTLKPNTSYTMSSNVPLGSTTLIYFNGTSSDTNGIYVNHSRTQTTDSNGKIFYALFINRDYYNDVVSGKYWIMLNEGSRSVNYEPYGNGDWYLEKKVRHISLNVSDMNNSEDYAGWKNVQQIKDDFPNQNNQLYNLTNYYMNISEYKLQACAINTNSTNKTFYLPKSGYNGLTQTQWMTNYPNLVVELYYGINPTYTKIEGELESQLNALSGAKSYNSQTNISQVNNDNVSILNATALSE